MKTQAQVIRHPAYYEVNVGVSTFLFRPDDYDALYHALRAEPASDVVWSSCVTTDMVSDPEDCGQLIDELDDAVERTCAWVDSEMN